jgi:hypothetical protein
MAYFKWQLSTPINRRVSYKYPKDLFCKTSSANHVRRVNFTRRSIAWGGTCCDFGLFQAFNTDLVPTKTSTSNSGMLYVIDYLLFWLFSCSRTY